jgi:hypothetical protein
MITPSQSDVPRTICTCTITRSMTRTRVEARHVTSPAGVCPRHTSVPLLTQISNHEVFFKVRNSQKSQIARSGL